MMGTENNMPVPVKFDYLICNFADLVYLYLVIANLSYIFVLNLQSVENSS